MKRKESKYNLPNCYTQSSIRLLESRFLRTDRKGNPRETPQTLFRRVAQWIASADNNYTKEKRETLETEREFYDVLFNLRFIPNSPTLLNAGKKNKTLSACFVLPLEDSLDSIYQTLSDAVQVQWKGGGTGFNFSNIRPKGDTAGRIPDVAAGPVHFIKTFSEALMGIRQGGKRGGANIAILNVDHPDIFDFIHLKKRDRTIMNFNISVGITEKFMKALRNDSDFGLVNPRTKKVVKKINAQRLFNEIVNLAHKTGDPGIAFIDHIDADNPTPKLGQINATNPCGEQPLLPYESCNLGALNLRTHFDYRKKDLNWNKLKETISIAVHFLDNIIDINYYALPKIEKMTRFANRKMGLGLMGFADVLMLKEIPYNSKRATRYAKKLMSFIQKEAIKASIRLAKVRGTFPSFKGSVWERRKLGVRNATITTIAPNGNTSIIGGSTGGIEPAYALVYKIGGVEDKNYRATKILFNINQAFNYLAKKYKFHSKKLLEKLAKNIPASEISKIPDHLKKVLVTASDIEPMWHLRMQAAFQKHVDNAISKTINFPNDATTDDVRRVFIEAYKLKLKGITIFRDGCKEAQTYVASQKAKLNIEEKKRRFSKYDIVIASENRKKIEQIKEFVNENNGNFEIVKAKFRLPVEDYIENKISEQGLLDSAIRNAKSVAEQTGKITIADESGFLFKKVGIPKFTSEIEYFSKERNYSSKLFKKIFTYASKKGSKAYISSAIAIYDPVNKRLLTTTTKIPGKLVATPNEKYKLIFVHKGVESFITPPTEEEFRSFHHRYKALQKILEKFAVYRKERLETDLTPNAYQVLEKRALKRDKGGHIVETPKQLFRRIARYVASARKSYNYTKDEVKKSEQNFFEILNSLEFQCGGAIIWAGMSDHNGRRAVWSKCFVLPIEDSIKSIFDTLNDNIEVLRQGGGTGFNFSRIRSTYSKVKATAEHAAGPIEYLKVYNRAQDTIIGRGGRQMGSMAILNVDHPNITDFIKAKSTSSEITHYNISVGLSSKFMRALRRNKYWELSDPHDRKVYKKVRSKKLFRLIAKQAHATGDPGLIFLDEIEKHNPTTHLGKIEATNPCGEQPLIPYESCNLGNIDVSKFIKNSPYLKYPGIASKRLGHKLKFFDWDRFGYVIKVAMEFMDNIIDINNYPIKTIEKMTKNTRSVGLGLMGFADMLIKLGIPYSHKDAVKVGGKIMKFLTTKAREASKELAKKRGNFPAFKGSIWAKKRARYMRNSRCTTIAPTGTISIIANCNPGIEPIFALVYKRTQSLGGQDQIVTDQLFEKVAKTREFYSQELMKQLAEGRSLSDIKGIPQDVVEIFQTSHEIDPAQHIKIQAAFQKYCDSGVSKTINLPKSTTVKEVEEIYKLAHKLKCKGITIFREGCKAEVQKAGLKEKEKEVKSLEQPRPRQTTTKGITTQVKTDQGSLYVTINEDDDGIAEVFLHIGKSGGYSSGYCEAIGRLISVAVRAGLKLDVIIDQLKGIRTSTPTLNKGMFVYSVPDAVAKILENYLKEQEGKISMFKETPKLEVKKEEEIVTNENERKESKAETAQQIEARDTRVDIKETQEDISSKYSNENHYDQLPECPDCGGDLQYAEGCMMCLSCGYSRCG